MVNHKRLIDFFEKLVQINSPSKSEDKIIAFLKSYFEKMGFECWEDNAGEITGGNANNLYGVLKGNPNRKSICFNSHADTVMPTENIHIINDGKIIKTDGKTVLGADDKGGIAIFTEAIQTVLDNDVDHGNIYILITVQEEIGAGGAECVECDSFRPDITYSFDTGKPTLCAVASAPTHYKMTYKIHGKAAHAAYSNGSINAVKVASDAISKLDTGQIDEETCCNIGKISGGARTNIVPEFCEVLAEARSQNDDKVESLVKKMTESFEKSCKKYGATLEKEINCEYRSFNIPEDDSDFVFAYNIAKDFVGVPFIEHSLGGFDASIFNAKGLKTIVYGIGYENIHSNREFIEIKDLITVSEFAYRLITEI